MFSVLPNWFWTFMIGGGVTLILGVLLSQLVASFLTRWHSRKNPNYTRNLTDAELAWLRENSAQLAFDKSDQAYPPWMWLFRGGVLPIILCMAVTGLLTSAGLARLNLPVPDNALIWSRLNVGVSLVLSVFLGIFLAAIAMIMLAPRLPALRDYLTFDYGWGYMNPHARGEGEIYTELEHQLRLEHVTDQSSYDAEALSEMIFHRTTPAWKGWTWGLGLTTLLFLALDTRAHYTIFENRVELSPYFSLKTYKYPLDDIIAIDRQCMIAVDDGELYPSLKVVARFPNHHNVNLLSDFGPDERQTVAVVQSIIEDRLNERVNDVVVKRAPIAKIDPTPEACQALIDKHYDGTLRDGYRVIMGFL